MKTILEIGELYGDWTIIKFDQVDHKRRRRYICKCQCGYETSLVAAAIANGRTKRCNKCKSLKLENQKFGDWSVLKRLPNDKHGKSVWLCKCKCGNERPVGGGNLVRGSSKCCFECGHNKTTFTLVIPSSWWYKTMDGARRRNHTWEITEEDALKVLKKQNNRCVLTGLILTFKPMTASLDRIDNNNGYTKENIQWVHKHLNIMKHKYQQDYFIEMCKLVALNNGVAQY